MVSTRSAQWSVLTAAEARSRLGTAELAKPFRDLVKYALRREETVLWCEGAWARPEELPRTDLARVALVVIDGPLVATGGLSLRYEDVVGGGHVARNNTAFLFLGEVRADDVFSVPDVLAMFPHGATIERLASFEGADSEVLIAHHLHAPIVVSGVSNSGATVAKGTDVRIGAYARHIVGLPAKAARSFDSLEELLPFLADELDKDDIWAVLEGLKGTPFPEGFALPAIAPQRTPGGDAGHSAGPAKRAPKPKPEPKAKPKPKRPKAKAKPKPKRKAAAHGVLRGKRRKRGAGK